MLFLSPATSTSIITINKLIITLGLSSCSFITLAINASMDVIIRVKPNNFKFCLLT